MKMGVSKVLDIVLVAGIGTVALFVLWRFDRRRSRLQKANRCQSGTWRQSDYYRRFLAGLDAANRVKFLAFGEHEQYKLYLDWTLREGLRGREEQSNI